MLKYKSVCLNLNIKLNGLASDIKKFEETSEKEKMSSTASEAVIKEEVTVKSWVASLMKKIITRDEPKEPSTPTPTKPSTSSKQLTKHDMDFEQDWDD